MKTLRNLTTVALGSLFLATTAVAGESNDNSSTEGTDRGGSESSTDGTDRGGSPDHLPEIIRLIFGGVDTRE